MYYIKNDKKKIYTKIIFCKIAKRSRKNFSGDLEKTIKDSKIQSF